MTRESTTTAPTTLREGDIYYWSWNAETLSQRLAGKCDIYHCLAGIAVVDNSGRLVDTYWYGGGNRVLDLAEVDLRYVANMGDLEPAPGGRHTDAHERYEPADVVDLTHRNGGMGVFLRKGAKPSTRVQVAAWTRKRDRAQSDVEFYQRLIDEAQGEARS